jgi:hypothetical protein
MEPIDHLRRLLGTSPSVQRRWIWTLAAIGAVVIGILVVVILRRSGPPNEFSSTTCENVLPGGARLRSSVPAGTPPSPPADAPNEAPAESDFRPGSAQAVFCADFADPFVAEGRSSLFRGPRFFAFATNVSGKNVPVLSSGNDATSDRVKDALPTLPPWSRPGSVWAPAILPREDRFVLYYTTSDRASGRQCISRAVAREPTGPYVDDSAAPMVCPVPLGGAIDPSPFVADDGTLHLLWKSDGNCCGVVTRIWSQPLTDDGLGIAGPAVGLITADQGWEAGVVEAPAMIQRDGQTYLFYSANAWDSASYAIGYAVCAGPAGPCRKPADQPWLGSGPEAHGPGGAEFFVNRRGSLRLVFHAWIGGRVGYESGGFRNLFATGIDFHEGVPVTEE